MAQTGYTPILIYSSSTASQAPSAGNLTNSTLGSELAINITDGKLFYKDNANAVQVIGWKTVPTTAGGTGLTSYTAGDLVYYASGTTFTKLAIGTSGQWLGSSGTAPQWNSPAALTKTDDTNVTLTLGGSASTSLLNAASLTLGWTGQLAATRGGTGFGTYAVGDLLYANTTTTLAKLADVATGNALISGGVGVAPSWGKIGLTTHVSGTLPVANGGTGITSLTNSQILWVQGGVVAQTSDLVWDGYHLLTASTTSLGAGQPGVIVTQGYRGRTGVGGSEVNTFNIAWNGAGANLWIDTSNTGQITTVSDYRIKKDVENMGDGALQRVMQLRPVTYKLKDFDIFVGSDEEQQGFIAHELQAVIESAVSGQKDETTSDGKIQPQSLKWAPIVAVLTKALQELKQEFDVYKNSHP